jgi:uncharacterized protein (DUF983 family)
MTQPPLKPFSLSAVFRARCPACQTGPVMRGLIATHPRCRDCGYDFNPENGFYLGAIAISYLITAILTVPPMIVLKVMNVDLAVLVVFPVVEFLFLGTFLMFYSRILWLHLEYRITSRRTTS